MGYLADLLRNLGGSYTQFAGSFLPGWAVTIIGQFIVAFILVNFGLVSVIGLIWVERKFSARLQDRLGPNRVGPWGLLQAIADALKLFTKEDVVPDGADKVSYQLSPILAVFPTLMLVAVIPWGPNGVMGVDLNIGVLYLVALGSIGTMAVLMGGWASNNKYALLGGFRVVAQLLSYEIPMVLSILVTVLLAGSMSTQSIVQQQGLRGWFIFLSPLAFLIYFLSSLAEGERTPFDLLEAESELVAGFHIEYSGMKFAWFYLAQYLNVLMLSAIPAALFLGGWQGPFVAQAPILGPIYFFIKTTILILINMWIRSTLPRIRIDQMMDFAWKVLVPLGLVAILLAAIAIKLPGGGLVQGLFLFVTNMIVIVIALGALGRYLRVQTQTNMRLKAQQAATA